MSTRRELLRLAFLGCMTSALQAGCGGVLSGPPASAAPNAAPSPTATPATSASAPLGGGVVARSGASMPMNQAGSGMGGMGGGMMGGMGGGMMGRAASGTGGMGGMGMMGGLGMGTTMAGNGQVASPATTPFQVPLPIPKVATPTVRTDASGAYDYYDLSIRPVQAEIIPGLKTPMFGYDGQVPGPTIVARTGRKTVVRWTNELPEPAVTHLHGAHVSPDHDGHSMDTMAPAGGQTGKSDGMQMGGGSSSREYVYENKQLPATLWYHDHAMNYTALHAYKGMAGFYVITDDVEEKLPLPKGEFDVGLAIQDKAFNPDGSLAYVENMTTLAWGFHGDRILVNGAIQPYFQVAARKYRFRILNGSNSRTYELALSTNQPFVQIGTDGGLLAKPVSRQSMLITPAERLDVIVDFSTQPVGSQVVLKNLLGSGTTADVMRFDVVRAAKDDSAIPDTLRPFEPIPTSAAKQTRRFTITMQMGMGMMGGMMGAGTANSTVPVPANVNLFSLNGVVYDAKRIDFTVEKDAVEIWEFVNPMGMMMHPMHAHAQQWQILDRNGAAPPEYERGWKDTFMVPAGGIVRVIGKFSDYVSKKGDPISTYMAHCHILEHEDHGMMLQFQVL